MFQGGTQIILGTSFTAKEEDIIGADKGIDPEVSTDGLTPGYDTRDRYPSVRSFTLGVNVKF